MRWVETERPDHIDAGHVEVHIRAIGIVKQMIVYLSSLTMIM